MKIEGWLKKNTALLQEAGIGTARLDCLVLLEGLIKKDRAWLLAHDETDISPPLLENLNSQISQRAKHIPLAQIRGKTEFYGREFIITMDTLEPRPESETMIELLKQLPLPKNPKIADVGSGSGAIGITAKLEIPASHVDFIEIDEKALKITKLNAKKHGVKGKFIVGNLLEKSDPRYDVLLANLPYVPDHYQINEAALNEPKVAIFGGPDGFDIYRRFFLQIMKNSLGSVKFVLTESLPFQHKELQKIAEKNGFKLVQTDDFIQVFTTG